MAKKSLLQIANIADPELRLRALVAWELDLRANTQAIADLKRRTVLGIRAQDPRPTWEQIGEILGVSGARAEQISRGQ